MDMISEILIIFLQIFLLTKSVIQKKGIMIRKCSLQYTTLAYICRMRYICIYINILYNSVHEVLLTLVGLFIKG